MPEPRTVPSEGAKDVVTFKLLVDGEALPGTFEVSGVVVFKGIGRVPFARIEVLDGDPATETFAASSSEFFEPGKTLEVLAGYRSEERPIFKGVVVGQELRIRQSGRGILTVTCRHPVFKATLTRRGRTRANVGDAEVISELLSNYGVDLSDESSSSVSHERLVQFNVTDWDFAVARARAIGAFLIPTDEGVTLAAPDFSQDAALELQFGATVLELDAEIDARSQPTEVTMSGWDAASQELLSSTGSEPSAPNTGNLSATELADVHGQPDELRHSGVVTQQELDTFSSSRLLLRRLAKVSGRVRCEGTPDPAPGKLISLLGVGERFSGMLFVSAVRHTIGGGRWHTDIQFGWPHDLSQEPSVDAPAAAAMVPAVRGLHTGVVDGLAGDPESEFRVRVLLPGLGADAAPIWARLASHDAGNQRGWYVYPEIGDEVVVAFVDDDPRHPVVLGSLYSAAHAAPLEPSDDNDEKGYFSRSELKLRFNDKTKTLVLQTPAGNVIELDEEAGGIRIEDQNGNKATFDSNGIALESASDIAIKAAGDIKLEATNIELEAISQFKASGNAGAELSASANTVVKGAVVQIN